MKEGGKEGAPVAAAAAAEGVPLAGAEGPAAAAVGGNEKSKEVVKEKWTEEEEKKEEDAERVEVVVGRGTGGPEDEGAGSGIRSVKAQMPAASAPAVVI